MTIFLVFPFTRLVHVWSAPVWYLGRRGYQVVRTPAERHRQAPGARRCAGGVTTMSCSVHTNIPAGKPVPVSVNGITIARDAIVREMQHHPANKPIAAWQHAARALVVRELLLQRARALDIAPEPVSDEAGRRETDDEAIMRAVVEREVALPRARRRNAAGAITRTTSRASARTTSTKPRISCSLQLRRTRPLTRRRAPMLRPCWAPCKNDPRLSPIWRGRIRAARRPHRAAISGRSRPGRPRRSSKRR